MLDTIAALDSGEIRAAEIYTAQSGLFEYHDEITTKQDLSTAGHRPLRQLRRAGVVVLPPLDPTRASGDTLATCIQRTVETALLGVGRYEGSLRG